MIDLIARAEYYLDHLAPVWAALPSDYRGVLYLKDEMRATAERLFPGTRLEPLVEGADCGGRPILAAAYGDAVYALGANANRPIILMEHGVGLTFGKAAYADGRGGRLSMSMFPVQSQYVLNKVHPDLRDKPHPIIGIPKLDPWAGRFNAEHKMPKTPTIAIAFHHGNRYSRPAEIGSAFEHYQDILPYLATRYNLIAHAHPIAAAQMRARYGAMRIEYVEHFDEIMRRANIFINDCSSAAYEFLVTGKPVILLNAPWFNRDAKWGLRFWDYSDIGIQVDDPKDLEETIDRVVALPNEHQVQRARAVSDLMPFMGESARRAVDEIVGYLRKTNWKPAPAPVVSRPAPPVRLPKFRPFIKTTDRGILYMCFGKAAEAELTRSIASLRMVGVDLPIAVIVEPGGKKSLGEVRREILSVIEWDGEDPFDGSQAGNFQFRAGRVKPFFYGLSPFKRTLYLDVDTEILADITPGFNFLEHWDFAIAKERLAVNQLYNQPRAGWQHNMKERDYTVEQFGGDGNFPYWNSGVFFFRKCKAVEEMFRLWYEEWMKWQQWDEQLSLMRAANRSMARIFVLAEVWNMPHRDQSKLIFHNYGRGAARTNVTHP